MRIRVWCLLACSLVGSFFSTSARTQGIAITHARLLDGTGGPVVADATILVEDKLIKAVGRTDVKIPAGAKVIDAKGKTAMPGLADMHVHLDGEAREYSLD